MFYWYYDYKIFKLEYLASEKGLTRIFFLKDFKKKALIFDPIPFKDVHKFILSYINKDPIDVNITLDYNPTKFQQSVYNETVKIPFGEVITYKELAIKINNPKAIRAVGGALGKNQFPILIPCHRIIGSNGKLTGFSAIGGIQLKKRLINFEQEVTNEF
ncbi:MAG: methylated-DNA--[protein]-cysteine S-methyltransferase [Clostridiales bacterium]|nr:methylated-DNA--[protein]-cysteine S-methyltransferase [Clostridiales bacterium]